MLLHGDRFHRCRIAVAFAQAEAVKTVQRQLSETVHEIEIEVSVGIDFGSTSVEALEALAGSDIETYLSCISSSLSIISCWRSRILF